MASGTIHANNDSGWIQLNSTYPTSYRKLNGWVFINLRLIGGATPSDGELLGILPIGYRPSVELTVVTQNLRGCLLVAPNGEVKVAKTPLIPDGLNNYIGACVSYPV